MESLFSQYSSGSQYPRTVRDAGLAAAIAVAVTLSFETSQFASFTPPPPGDTPWVVSGRTRMNTLRFSIYNQVKWGVARGWVSVPGTWRNLPR
ncbi:MAG TPA: hypothetical protein ENN67_01200 [Firmicutes bacterium]|nr:hypothetical protein [Bacillota bacterium]